MAVRGERIVMHSFEFILVFSILLGTLALFSHAIHAHHSSMMHAQQALDEKWFALHCSSLADAAAHHYTLTPSRACLHYPYALSPPSSPFWLVLGGDANHYD